MQLDRITKPSVVLPTNGSVISYSLARRMRLELTRANVPSTHSILYIEYQHIYFVAFA